MAIRRHRAPLERSVFYDEVVFGNIPRDAVIQEERSISALQQGG